MIALAAMFSGSFKVSSVQAGVENLRFNWNDQTQFKDPLRGFQREGDNLQELLMSEIQSAQHSIEIAVFQFALPEAARALVEKQRRGVKVRVVVDNKYTTSESDNVDPKEILQTDSMAILKAGGVQVIDDTADGSRGSGIMHHKFMIIDRKAVLTGSANFTPSDLFGDIESPKTRGNANSLFVVRSHEFAAAFYEEFSYLWGEATGTPLFGSNKPYRAAQKFKLDDGVEIELQFAPRASTLIERALDQTTRSADLGLFVFSEQNYANRMEHIVAGGGKVRALIEGSFAYRWYSEVLDMLGLRMLDERCRWEQGNRPWRNPVETVGVPNMPEGDKFHHKFAVLDSQRVIYGSYNWSSNAELNNDETLMHIRSVDLAQQFESEFERHYRRAKLGLPLWLRNRVMEHNENCVPVNSAVSVVDQDVLD